MFKSNNLNRKFVLRPTLKGLSFKILKIENMNEWNHKRKKISQISTYRYDVDSLMFEKKKLFKLYISKSCETQEKYEKWKK